MNQGDGGKSMLSYQVATENFPLLDPIIVEYSFNGCRRAGRLGKRQNIAMTELG